MEMEGQEVSAPAGIPTANEILGEMGIKPEVTEENALDLDSVDSGTKVKTAQEILEDEEALNQDEKEDANSKESVEKSDEFFEIKYNDQIKKLTKDEIKEYAQKGFDYTQKTQEVARERKEFEALRQKYDADLEKAVADVEAKHQALGEKSKIIDVWDHALEDIEAKNPELYQEIARHFSEAKRSLENPVTKRLQSELEQTRALVQQLQENLNKGGNDAKDLYIRKTFQDEMTKVQDKYSNKFSALGLKADWDKVKNAWIAGEQSGMTVHQALMAVHGEDIVKLYESRTKVDGAKTRSDLISKKPPTTGGLAKISGKAKASPDLMRMKDADFWQQLAKETTKK